MTDKILLVGMALLACVGLIDILSWIALRKGSRRGRVFRIFPIGTPGKNPGQQMAMMYSCLQWEANPSRQVYVLYDVGLDEQGLKDCTTLAESCGVLFVRSPEELAALLHTK